MHVVLDILGVILVLVGVLLLLVGKDEERKQGAFVAALGAVLCIIGVESGRSVQSVKVSATSMEVSFSDEPVVLSRQQTTGAQQAQQVRLTPKPLLASSGEQRIATGDLFAAAARRYQEQTATLHAALQQQGFTPMADPTLDISPGAVVSVGADGKVTLHFSQRDAFPGLKTQSSTFDFEQFTSMGGTKIGFRSVGRFTCEQGFRESRDEGSHTFVMTGFAAYGAMKSDPSLKVVRSVLGCTGWDTLDRLFKGSQPVPQKRYILGFQLMATVPD